MQYALNVTCDCVYLFKEAGINLNLKSKNDLTIVALHSAAPHLRFRVFRVHSVAQPGHHVPHIGGHRGLVLGVFITLAIAHTQEHHQQGHLGGHTV